MQGGLKDAGCSQEDDLTFYIFLSPPPHRTCSCKMFISTRAWEEKRQESEIVCMTHPILSLLDSGLIFSLACEFAATRLFHSLLQKMGKVISINAFITA